MRNNYRNIWACGWIIAVALCLLPGQSSAQDTQQQPGGSHPRPTPTAEPPCELDFHLNVITLKTNDKEMYWKMTDCIRIDVINNPFIYTYKLEFNEQKIAEDDILGSLGSLFGLKSITGGGQNNPAAANKAGGKQAVNPFAKVVSPKSVKAAPKACDPQQKDTLASLAAGIQQLNLRIAVLEQSARALTTLKDPAADLDGRLRAKEKDYEAFQLAYLAQRATLVDNTTDLNSLRQRALALQSESLLLAKELSGDTGFESDMVKFFESARLLNKEFNQLSTEASLLVAKLSVAPVCTQKGGDPELSAIENQTQDASDKIAQDISDLEAKASQVAFTACKYKSRKDGEFAWVDQQVFRPLTAVLANPVAFGVSWVKRVGPYADPTAVTATLKRDVIIDKSGTSIPAADNSVFECSNDPSTIFQSNNSFSTVDDLPVPKAKAQSGTASSGSGKLATDTSKTATDKTQEATTVVLEQPWFFGKARFVLTGGLTTGFLGKKEFQRSSSISGATSPTVIGLKTDTRYRLTPMLYGHTLMYSKRHDSDAWYATLGVTANSDSKGTSPEFLLGGSRSFAQQKFFLTLGAYIGERQKLDGGLQVGQTIPSTLTGELPVTKSYHASWGFGISYRFASSKDPQTNSPAPAKPSGGTKKSGS
jgi:hypothetical protein